MAAEHGNQEPVGQTAPGLAVGQLATVVPATAIALAKSNGIAIKNFLDTCIAAPWIKSVNESWRHDNRSVDVEFERKI
jgi:post-segregation antitoxin (ccd killing protein)